VAETKLLPTDILTRNWDKEAASRLPPFHLETYYAKTEKARQDWQQAQAIYQHSSGTTLFRRHPWRQLEAKTASHFLEYQSALWSVYMSLRLRTHKAFKD
jgi:hypothetical protein